MRLGPLGTLCVACLVLAGCQPGRRMVANSELERENRELRRTNEILKAAASFFGAELDRRGKR